MSLHNISYQTDFYGSYVAETPPNVRHKAKIAFM